MPGGAGPTRRELGPRGENPANGVFVLNYHNPLIWIWAGTEDHGKVHQMSLGNIRDGTSKTLMLSESVHTWYYAFDGVATTAEFEPGFEGAPLSKDISEVPHTPHLFGFTWRNNPAGIERINGDNSYDQLTGPIIPKTMWTFSQLQPRNNSPNLFESYSYPSSDHPSGVNAAFCGGNARYISESIDPKIYVAAHDVGP